MKIPDWIPPLSRKITDYIRCIDTQGMSKEDLDTQVSQMIAEHSAHLYELGLDPAAPGADRSDYQSVQPTVAFHPILPRIVCLCGSTRFMEAFQKANLAETLAGRIVLSIGCNTKSDTDLMAAGEMTSELKTALDELHKRKIDLADEILVLNVGGYVGESTRSEIIYADRLKKPIRWLEPMACPFCKGRGGFDLVVFDAKCALCHGSGRVGSGIRDQASGTEQETMSTNPAVTHPET